MRGHITKRGKNSYSIAVSLGKDATTNKYKYQWVSVKGTKKDAEKRLSEILHQIDNGIFVRPVKLSVKELLEQWLRDYVECHCTPKTIESYGQLINRHLIPELGNIRLVELEARHLQAMYARKKASGLSNRTVRYLYSLMAEALTQAVKQGILHRNVALLTEPPRIEHKTVTTLKPEHVSAFCNAAESTPFYCLFYLLLHTGMRRGEALALKWKNVDMGLANLGIQAYLSVTQSLGKVNGNTLIKEPKTGAGRRRIALSPSLNLVLRQHKKAEEVLRASLGATLTEEDYVFCHSDGSSYDPSTVSHSFRKVLRRAGLPPMPLHGLRHSHATMLLEAGIHPRVVMERLGHSSIRVTLDTYSHVVGGLQEMAAQKLDDFISAKNESISNLLAK
ncbi:tyrosine-type recombinase/integrase [Chloroflexota bacterium]